MRKSVSCPAHPVPASGHCRLDQQRRLGADAYPVRILTYPPRVPAGRFGTEWLVQVVPAPRASLAPVGLTPEPVPRFMPGLLAVKSKTAFGGQPVYQRASLLVCACLSVVRSGDVPAIERRSITAA